jgi:hypothetical protein
MRRILYAILLLGALRTPGRAELWVSRMGELLHSASRIEIIHVGTVSKTAIDGNVVAAVRSTTRIGAAIHVELEGLVTPVPGDDVLVICDSLCPRAAGIDDHGAFSLRARELMDGAFVTPNLVDRASLAMLAAGKAAPELCVKGTIHLLDEPAAPALDVRVSSSDGTGKGTLDGRELAAQVDGLLREPGGIALRLGGIELVSRHVARDAAGCFTAAFLPNRPVARTRKSLDAVLRGKPAGSKLATGTFEVAKGLPVAAGRHTLDLSLDRDGNLVAGGDLASRAVEETNRSEGHVTIGFPTTGAFYPMLVIDLATTAKDTTDAGAAVASILAAKPTTTAEVVLVTMPERAATRTRLGTIELRYLREP